MHTKQRGCTESVQEQEEVEEETGDETSKRSRDEDEVDGEQEEKSWKKKKLNWLRTIAKAPGLTPISKVQVVELYSPERVNKVAKEKGMTVGLSMDLTTGWNFDNQEDRELAEKYIREYKPMFVIGSPMCTMFSRLQELNKNRDTERFQERFQNGVPKPSRIGCIVHSVSARYLQSFQQRVSTVCPNLSTQVSKLFLKA